MAEKKDDENWDSVKNYKSRPEEKNGPDESGEGLELDLGNRNHSTLEQIFDSDQLLSSYESPLQKEENPFSFKRFLNQDSSKHRNKGARRKIYSPVNLLSPNEFSASKHSFNPNSSEMSTRLVNTPEMSSVLPDFVQDHLVVEQCYLSGSAPTIDIDNFNLQNLPDLNLEHRELDFPLNIDRKSQSPSSLVTNNLPDFTLNAGHFNSANLDNASQKLNNNNKSLPDFALNASNRIFRTSDNKVDKLPDFTVNNSDMSNINRAVNQRNETVDSSQMSRHRNHMSASPSVPLDLPSYEANELTQAAASVNGPLPFDLPIHADERSSNTRGMPPSEAVSKSLPDFLSDGPIRKERFEDNNQTRGNLVSSGQNEECSTLSGPEAAAPRSEQDRLERELELMHRQLTEKNRKIVMLESQLQHFLTRDQREANNLEYALQQVENNLKDTIKRAATAESTMQKLKQENKLLKAELSSLRSENSSHRLGNCPSSTPPHEMRNQRIAKDLRVAANAAEKQLRSLLTGIENLRVIAGTVENMHRVQDVTDDFQNFSYEDSASGPAL